MILDDDHLAGHYALMVTMRLVMIIDTISFDDRFVDCRLSCVLRGEAFFSSRRRPRRHFSA